MDKWFDVHFSINGFMKIQGRDDDDAAAKAEEILEAYTGDIERLLKTGVGIEVADVVPEGSRADEGWYAVASGTMKKAGELELIKVYGMDIVYLINAVGEVTGYGDIEPDVYKWCMEASWDNDWLQYLVDCNGEKGLLALIELSYPDCDHWDIDKKDYSQKWADSSYDEIWEHLCKVVDNIQERIDFKVYLGKETGIYGRHELCIFFPYRTSADEIEAAFRKIADVDCYGI